MDPPYPILKVEDTVCSNKPYKQYAFTKCTNLISINYVSLTLNFLEIKIRKL